MHREGNNLFGVAPTLLFIIFRAGAEVYYLSAREVPAFIIVGGWVPYNFMGPIIKWARGGSLLDYSLPPTIKL
jgi:hypothetical protein